MLAAGVSCLAWTVHIVLHAESVFSVGDARFYMGIATNDYSQVMQPFASRQLGALLVAGMAHAFHWTIERGFVIEGALSFVFILASLYFFIARTRAPRWIAFAIAFVPWWVTLLAYLVLPDLWYSALLMVLFLLISEDQMLLAALMMFPLMLSRESTSLTLVCFLIACWKVLRWRDRIVSVTATVAAALVVSRLAARAQSNTENLPAALYMMAKVPWNFAHNVLGIVPWSNVYPDLCRTPAWSFPLHAGPVRAIGVCGFSFFGWVEITQAALTTFGLLPLLMVYVWRRTRKTPGSSILVRFALLYGFVSLLLAPMLGTWIVHLIGYAWPMFFVALPLMFNQLPETCPKGRRALAAAGFFVAHLMLFWASSKWLWYPQIAIDAVLWIVGWALLHYWFSQRYRAPVLNAAPGVPHEMAPSE